MMACMATRPLPKIWVLKAFKLWVPYQSLKMPYLRVIGYLPKSQVPKSFQAIGTHPYPAQVHMVPMISVL